MLFSLRLRSTGRLPRLELADVERLLPVLREEWGGLRFDRKGRLQNPITGVTEPVLTLVSGRHREPGARYEILVPVAPPAEADGPITRRRRPSHQRVELVLHRDAVDGIDATLAGEHNSWTALVQLTWGDRLPNATIEASFSPRRLALIDGDPAVGCGARLLGRRGAVQATIDLGRLATEASTRGRSLVEGHASLGLGRAEATIDVENRRDTWDVVALAKVKARGLARPVVAVFGRRWKASFEASQRSWWNETISSVGAARDDLEDLHRDIDAAGGPEAFVHRELWDPSARAARAAKPRRSGPEPAGQGDDATG